MSNVKMKKSISKKLESLREFDRELNAIRERIVVIGFELEDLDDAPLSEAEIKERVEIYCDSVVKSAESGLKGFAGLAVGKANFDVSRAVDLSGASPGANMILLHGLTPLLAWALSDEKGLRAKTLEVALRPGAGKARMSQKDKAAKKAALIAERDELEMQEEVAVRMGERANMPITRRPDVPGKWLIAPDSELGLED